jgi:hypothetical protein
MAATAKRLTRSRVRTARNERHKVNQGELRQDRDEWRWRAERLLADLKRGGVVAVLEPGC